MNRAAVTPTFQSARLAGWKTGATKLHGSWAQCAAKTVEATHAPACNEGVPPASSPSVSIDESPGGETPRKLAAVTAALRHAG